MYLTIVIVYIVIRSFFPRFKGTKQRKSSRSLSRKKARKKTLADKVQSFIKLSSHVGEVGRTLDELGKAFKKFLTFFLNVLDFCNGSSRLREKVTRQRFSLNVSEKARNSRPHCDNDLNSGSDSDSIASKQSLRSSSSSSSSCTKSPRRRRGKLKKKTKAAAAFVKDTCRSLRIRKKKRQYS